jgi:hypothetical protein
VSDEQKPGSVIIANLTPENARALKDHLRNDCELGAEIPVQYISIKLPRKLLPDGKASKIAGFASTRERSERITTVP